MCGRFSLTVSWPLLAKIYNTDEIDPFPPRYNIAPTQPVAIINTTQQTGTPGNNLPERQFMLARWGLIPAWVRDPKDFPLLFNARSETAATKASFRAAFRHRRVLIPASGFYEWKRDSVSSQPYWIYPASEPVTTFAGLMETYMASDGSEMDTVTILTTQASEDLAAIHPRMPVVLSSEQFDGWLDCRNNESRDVVGMLSGSPPGYFDKVPVSDAVNKVANNSTEIQRPVEIKSNLTAPKAETPQLSLFD